MTGLSTGIYIHSKLSNSPEITTIVNDNIFPMTTETEVQFPFILYTTSTVPDDNKDCCSGDIVDVTILVNSNKYKQVVEISELVRSALTGKRSDEFGIMDCRFEFGTCKVVEGVQVGELSFTILTE